MDIRNIGKGIIVLAFLLYFKLLLISTGNMEYQPNFDKLSYVGRWYLQMRSKYAFYTQQECTCQIFTAKNDNTVRMVNIEFDQSNGVFNYISGHISFHEFSGNVQFMPYIPAGKYNVLATDYTTYSIVHMMINYYFGIIHFTHFLTRERNPSLETLDLIKSVVKSKIVDFPFQDMLQVSQDSQCQYLSDTELLSALNQSTWKYGYKIRKLNATEE